ncbi:MAG: pilus assembly protein PilM [Patescibacteria group bacterium]
MHNFLQKIKNFSVLELRPEPIAISFNDSSLRFLTLQKKTSSILPENYWREALPKNTVVGGEIKEVKVFANCLKNGLHKIGVGNKKATHAIIVLPENATFLQPLSLPKMSKEEIDASLATLVEQNIPLSKEEVEADWQFVDSNENNQQTNILVAATSKIGIEKILEAMRTASIVPVALDLAPLSIVRSLINKADEKSRLIIHFNHDKTIFVLHDGKSIDLAMSSLSGIDFIQKKIATELHADPSTGSGRDPSAAFDLMSVKEFSNDNVKEKKALENSLADIIDQINKFKSFEHSPSEKSDSKKHCVCQEIVLSGYLASLQVVANVISQKTNLPVVVGNPWQQNGELDIIPKMNLSESLQFCATIGGAIYARQWFLNPVLE